MMYAIAKNVVKPEMTSVLTVEPLCLILNSCSIQALLNFFIARYAFANVMKKQKTNSTPNTMLFEAL